METIVTSGSIKDKFANTITGLPDGFKYLNEICPDIMQDIKYATEDNFTGVVVPGYHRPVAILTEVVCLALKQIQEELAKNRLSLLIWDAYRPVQAVDYFLQWEDIPDVAHIKARFYPEYEKHHLFELGFIAPGHSAHSRGSTVDLTIFSLDTNQGLDMGTEFDFFGKKSYASCNSIDKHAIENRHLLRNLMIKYGFRGITQEWWHFTFANEPFKDQYFNFPVS